MSSHKPKNPLFKESVVDSFARQEAMKTVGASIVSVGPGCVELGFTHDQSLTQHHGFIHAGFVTTVLDSACGYAAFTLMPENTTVLTIEFKTNLLAPALGESYRAIGQVKKAGRTITVCDGELFAMREGEEKLVATMTGTLMCVANRD
ncbi:MAG: PaaI family thioesterase [Pseudomonadota bacterium]